MRGLQFTLKLRVCAWDFVLRWDTSCQREIMDFWRDIKTWKSPGSSFYSYSFSHCPHCSSVHLLRLGFIPSQGFIEQRGWTATSNAGRLMMWLDYILICSALISYSVCCFKAAVIVCVVALFTSLFCFFSRLSFCPPALFWLRVKSASANKEAFFLWWRFNASHGGNGICSPSLLRSYNQLEKRLKTWFIHHVLQLSDSNGGPWATCSPDTTVEWPSLWQFKKCGEKLREF